MALRLVLLAQAGRNRINLTFIYWTAHLGLNFGISSVKLIVATTLFLLEHSCAVGVCKFVTLYRQTDSCGEVVICFNIEKCAILVILGFSQWISQAMPRELFFPDL